MRVLWTSSVRWSISPRLSSQLWNENRSAKQLRDRASAKPSCLSQDHSESGSQFHQNNWFSHKCAALLCMELRQWSIVVPKHLKCTENQYKYFNIVNVGTRRGAITWKKNFENNPKYCRFLELNSTFYYQSIIFIVLSGSRKN